MQIASQPRIPMVRSMAAPAPAVSVPAQPAPAAPMAPIQSVDAGQDFSKQLGAFTQKAQSFFSNLWDTVIGPAINSLISMVKGLFGG
jgi:hypothetical protein